MGGEQRSLRQDPQGGANPAQDAVELQVGWDLAGQVAHSGGGRFVDHQAYGIHHLTGGVREEDGPFEIPVVYHPDGKKQDGQGLARFQPGEQIARRSPSLTSAPGPFSLEIDGLEASLLDPLVQVRASRPPLRVFLLWIAKGFRSPGDLRLDEDLDGALAGKDVSRL